VQRFGQVGQDATLVTSRIGPRRATPSDRPK